MTAFIDHVDLLAQQHYLIGWGLAVMGWLLVGAYLINIVFKRTPGSYVLKRKFEFIYSGFKLRIFSHRKPISKHEVALTTQKETLKDLELEQSQKQRKTS
ncbi:MAG: hypothetical protein N0E54_03000 [Candidatus Thiodiazotropha taylori]|nr:hypothetical protein [Candidatus Thiodiazotropha endolucinida]MCW4227694.1 hypothetical protein [Candidatus Thiodiazotropha taylori]